MSNVKKLRVWWIPQVPGKSFCVEVSSVEEGVKLMGTLAAYDIFQYENSIKPDYSNAGGLEVFDPEETTDDPNGSWVDWHDQETGEDDPQVYLESKFAQGSVAK